MYPDMWWDIWEKYYNEKERAEKSSIEETDDDICPFCSMPVELCDCLDD